MLEAIKSAMSRLTRIGEQVKHKSHSLYFFTFAKGITDLDPFYNYELNVFKIMAITFFKTPKNKHFNYKPVYWDKAKEEREKRMKSALQDNDKEYAQALRERLELRWKRSTGATARKNSNIRLVAIIFLLALVSYYLFIR
jgi:CRISPR/Cas system endoribonuclease Cas6 (RAMP superfamily)